MVNSNYGCMLLRTRWRLLLFPSAGSAEVPLLAEAGRACFSAERVFLAGGPSAACMSAQKLIRALIMVQNRGSNAYTDALSLPSKHFER